MTIQRHTKMAIQTIFVITYFSWHLTEAQRFKDERPIDAIEDRQSGLDWWVILMTVLGSIIGGVILCCACFYCVTHIFFNDIEKAKKEKMRMERARMMSYPMPQGEWNNVVDMSNIYSEIPGVGRHHSSNEPHNGTTVNFNKAMPPRYQSNSQQHLPEYVGGGPHLKGESSNGGAHRY